MDRRAGARDRGPPGLADSARDHAGPRSPAWRPSPPRSPPPASPASCCWAWAAPAWPPRSSPAPSAAAPATRPCWCSTAPIRARCGRWTSRPTRPRPSSWCRASRAPPSSPTRSWRTAGSEWPPVSRAGRATSPPSPTRAPPWPPWPGSGASAGCSRADPDVGGRFSALSHFGLVPAALIGADLGALLDEAAAMAAACRRAPADNPGLRARRRPRRAGLGRPGQGHLPGLPRPGRPARLDRATGSGEHRQGTARASSPSPASRPGRPEAYGDDRLFVYLSVDGDPDEAQAGAVDALEAAGHPVVRLPLRGVCRPGRRDVPLRGGGGHGGQRAGHPPLRPARRAAGQDAGHQGHGRRGRGRAHPGRARRRPRSAGRRPGRLPGRRPGPATTWPSRPSSPPPLRPRRRCRACAGGARPPAPGHHRGLRAPLPALHRPTPQGRSGHRACSCRWWTTPIPICPCRGPATPSGAW